MSDGPIRRVKEVRWWRSRRDPFETTWPLLRQWFDAEPECTGRELFERLQADYPGVHPDGQLRTLQRRLKGWRREAARRLVFTTPTVEPHWPAQKCPVPQPNDPSPCRNRRLIVT